MSFLQRFGSSQWAIYLVVASCLMPLLLPASGLRVEHLAIPVFFLYALLVHGMPAVHRVAGGGLLAMAWLAALFSAMFPPHFDLPCVKELVNFSKAPLLIVAFGAIFFNADAVARDRLLLRGIRAYALVMLINTSAQVYSTQVDISEMAAYFVETEPGSLWWLCHSANRHTGFVAMPATVGAMASFALIAAFASRRVGGGNVLFSVLAATSAISAFLAMSKVYLATAPVIVLLLFSGNLFTIMSMVLAGVFSLYIIGERNEASGQWLNELVDVGFDIGSLTAGRFSSSSQGSVAEGFAFVTARSPILGVGPGRFNVLSGLPYDSEYLLYYASAGVVGLGIYLSFYLWLIVLAFKRMKNHATRFEGRCLLCLVVVISAASVGVPVLTGNNSVPMIALLISWAILPKAKSGIQIVAKKINCAQ